MTECQQYFFQEVKQIRSNICVISLKACTEKTKTSNFTVKSLTFFAFTFF